MSQASKIREYSTFLNTLLGENTIEVISIEANSIKIRCTSEARDALQQILESPDQMKATILHGMHHGDPREEPEASAAAPGPKRELHLPQTGRETLDKLLSANFQEEVGIRDAALEENGGLATFTITVPADETPINLKIKLAKLDKMLSALSRTDQLLRIILDQEAPIEKAPIDGQILPEVQELVKVEELGPRKAKVLFNYNKLLLMMQSQGLYDTAPVIAPEIAEIQTHTICKTLLLSHVARNLGNIVMHQEDGDQVRPILIGNAPGISQRPEVTKFCLAIDTSGSIVKKRDDTVWHEDKKLSYKIQVQQIIDSLLQDVDGKWELDVITFSNEIQEIRFTSEDPEHKQAIKDFIKNIEFGRATLLHEAMQEAMTKVARAGNIVFVTDGKDNVNYRHVDESHPKIAHDNILGMYQKAREASLNKLSVTAIGLGDRYDKDFFTELRKKGFWTIHLDSPDKLQEVGQHFKDLHLPTILAHFIGEALQYLQVYENDIAVAGQTVAGSAEFTVDGEQMSAGLDDAAAARLTAAQEQARIAEELAVATISDNPEALAEHTNIVAHDHNAGNHDFTLGGLGHYFSG